LRRSGFRLVDKTFATANARSRPAAILIGITMLFGSLAARNPTPPGARLNTPRCAKPLPCVGRRTATNKGRSALCGAFRYDPV
jgi:hypothetical protein